MQASSRPVEPSLNPVGLVGPELVFALVAAVGTDLELVAEVLTESLAEVRYRVAVVHVIELLREITGLKTTIQDEPIRTRYSSRMDAGNEFRRRIGRGDALASLAVRHIQELRATETGDPDKPSVRRAFVIRSLKHPDEVRRLREIYGRGVFVIAAHSPPDVRLDNLARKIAGSRYSVKKHEHEEQADELIRRDSKESDPLGQNVRDTFPLADFFVDASKARSQIKEEIGRFIALLFGNQFLTTTRDDY
jgi:cytidine deaminase